MCLHRCLKVNHYVPVCMCTYKELERMFAHVGMFFPLRATCAVARMRARRPHDEARL